MSTMKRVPFTITNNSISFYAGGRMHSVTQADPASYAGLRAALQTPTSEPHDVDLLLGFVDVRQALVNQSRGRIVFIGDEIVFNGKVQHNLWVDKILEFRQAGEPFEPIWNALDRLLKNPTPQAITRLPIFLERAGLGFLPDGRFVAFKGVTSNFESAHVSADGTRFRHHIGDRPTMDRSEVDADPDRTCSTGLHVGAPDYVRSHYSGGTFALVLVAVDPADVVCVPTDYQGGKMRVCSYEVIDHLDQSYSDELFGRLRTTVRGYEPPAAPEFSEAEKSEHYDAQNEEIDEQLEDEDESWTHGIAVGDVITTTDETYGVVTWIGDDDLQMRDPEGDVIEVSEEFYAGLILGHERCASMVACVGALIRVADDPIVRDGDYTITGVDLDNGHTQDDDNDSYFQIGDTFTPIQNSSIRVVSFKGGHLWPVFQVASGADGTVTVTSLDGSVVHQVISAGIAHGFLPALTAQVGDLVVISEGGWPPAGTYPVIGVTGSYSLTVATEHDGLQGVPNQLVSEVISRPAFRAEIGGQVFVTGHQLATATWLEVINLGLTLNTPQVQVRTNDGPVWVDADYITAIQPKA